MVLETCLKLAWERAGGRGWEGRCAGDPTLSWGAGQCPVEPGEGLPWTSLHHPSFQSSSKPAKCMFLLTLP